MTSQKLPQYYHRIDQIKTDPGQYFGYNNDTGFSNYARYDIPISFKEMAVETE